MTIQNANLNNYSGIKKTGYKSPKLPYLKPVKRNFAQRIWHNIKSFIRANKR